MSETPAPAPIGLADLFAAGLRDEEVHRILVPDDWLQGRTLYGGATAALSLAAVMERWPDLPPLRSVQIAFIGPTAGEIIIRPTLLRRGRTAAFVEVALSSPLGAGLRAIFIFMHGLDSHVDRAAEPLTADSLPDLGTPIPTPNGVRFVERFELRKAGVGEPGVPEILRWARLREAGSLDPFVELLAIGDVLPPAAMKLFTRPGPISSMNWQVNFLTDRPATRDGWWLASTRADQARHGSSSQQMKIWNRDGEPVVAAMQSVALFV